MKLQQRNFKRKSTKEEEGVEEQKNIEKNVTYEKNSSCQSLSVYKHDTNNF